MIKSKRKEIGLTQTELAKILGLHQTCISKIELHKRQLSLNLIKKISYALDLDCIELVKEYMCKNCNNNKCTTKVHLKDK